MADACAVLGWEHVAVLAHSYGTFVTARLCKRHPTLVRAMCIVDPVCMLTCFPDLLRNFVYNVFVPGRALKFLLKDGIKGLVARDYLIAHTFCRVFRWHEVQLWPDQFPERSLVVLARNDPLVPCELALRQIAQFKAINPQA